MKSLDKFLKYGIGIIAALLVLAALGFSAFYYFSFLAPRDPGTQVQSQTRELEQAVKDNPNDADARASVAKVYYEEGRYDQAASQAEAALKLNPKHQGALLVLGETSYARGDTDRAIEALQNFVNLNKGSSTAKANLNLELVYYTLGGIYASRGKPDAAIENYRAALEIDAGDADAQLGLGRVLEKAGRHDEAIVAFNGATRYVPDFREAYEGLLNCYEAVKRAGGIAYARGMVAYATGDFANAVKLLQEAVVQAPQWADAHVGLGMARERVGETEAARAEYETALKLDDRNFLAKYSLGRLNR